MKFFTYTAENKLLTARVRNPYPQRKPEPEAQPPPDGPDPIGTLPAEDPTLKLVADMVFLVFMLLQYLQAIVSRAADKVTIVSNCFPQSWQIYS
jgi:hypothetical protein